MTWTCRLERWQALNHGPNWHATTPEKMNYLTRVLVFLPRKNQTKWKTKTNQRAILSCLVWLQASNKAQVTCCTKWINLDWCPVHGKTPKHSRQSSPQRVGFSGSQPSYWAPRPGLVQSPFPKPQTRNEGKAEFFGRSFQRDFGADWGKRHRKTPQQNLPKEVNKKNHVDMSDFCSYLFVWFPDDTPVTLTVLKQTHCCSSQRRPPGRSETGPVQEIFS